MPAAGRRLAAGAQHGAACAQVGEGGERGRYQVIAVCYAKVLKFKCKPTDRRQEDLQNQIEDVIDKAKETTTLRP
ncbi:beta-1,3-galactosyltransferase 1 isoform X2 [Pezoporus wallicus]|uniref:beta-1,3-galactosyltransferase 1 isoform X2 n=1 Tax=Pezoporus wallicus TaxID=35540 RepID=UPI00254C942E|nr:beta-1,3-galactosyltransferase 1 isoform X2 [Pezoporus wallicus]